MKDFRLRDLATHPISTSVPTGRALSPFEAWVEARPELWSVGREIQAELFAEAVRAPYAV